MRSKYLGATLSLLLVITCLWAIQPGYAQDPSPAGAVAALTTFYQSFSDYQCRITLWSTKDRRQEERVVNLYFKKPRLIRMDIIAGNKALDVGSVGVYSGGNKIIGHKGGVMSGMVVKLDKHSPMATTLRGVAFDESDLQGTLDRLHLYLRQGRLYLKKVSATESELVALVADPAQNGGVSREVFRFNPQTLFPLSADNYQGDCLVQHVAWSNYLVNTGLPSELFNLQYNPANLTTQGIPSIHQLPLNQPENRVK